MSRAPIRTLLFFLLALVALSCGNDEASLPSAPGELALAAGGECAPEALIQALFPGGLANAAVHQCANIQRQYASGETEEAYEMLGDLIRFVMEHLEGGRLEDPDGVGPETAMTGAADLIVALNAIVGLADGSEVVPAAALLSDGGTIAIVEAEAAWRVETPDGFAAVTKAPNVPVHLNGEPYNGPVTVFIAPIDPSETSFPDFGLEVGGEDRGAFPLFKDIGTIPEGLQFGDGEIFEEDPNPLNEIVVELCVVDPPHALAPLPAQIPDLRVGHIVGESVKVAPLRASTLDCTGVNDDVPMTALGEGRWRHWASVALGPVARLLEVPPLHAEPGRLGGAISSFSEFGGVDQTQVIGQPAICAEPPSGMIAWWRFDEDSGSTTVDHSDHGHDGSLNGPSWVPGLTGSALRFDGVDDYVLIDASMSLFPMTISVETWIRTLDEPPSWVSILGDGNAADGEWGVSITMNPSGHIHAVVAGGSNNHHQSSEFSSQALNDGAWHQVAIVYDDETKLFQLYIDGELDWSGDNAMNPSEAFAVDDHLTHHPQVPWTLGVHAQHFAPVAQLGPHFYEGDIDDTVIYDRVVTADDIAATYELGGLSRCDF